MRRNVVHALPDVYGLENRGVVGGPLRWPRDTLYPLRLALIRRQAAAVRSV
jgi:hypothetical protein